MLKMADKQKNTAQESTAKLQRRIDKLSAHLSESEERYIEMHQKYIDEKRDNEEKLAIM
jgi:chromosome segregation ATPase